LKKANEALEKEVEELKKGMSKVEEYPKRIKLKVGGMMFETLQETLTNGKSILLTTIFTGNYKMEKGKDEAYFIDKDPSSFRLILDHLRGYPFPVEELTSYEQNILYQDAMFFQCPELCQKLKTYFQQAKPNWLIDSPQQQLEFEDLYLDERWENLDTSRSYGMLYEISENGKTFRKAQRNEIITVIRGTTPLSGTKKYKFRFRVKNRADTESIDGLGFSNLSSNCWEICGMNCSGAVYINTSGTIFIENSEKARIPFNWEVGTLIELTLDMIAKEVTFQVNSSKKILKWDECTDKVFVTACFRKLGWEICLE